MKKTFVLLILTCLLISCGQNQNAIKRLTPVKPEQNFLSFRMSGYELIEFDIDTLADFRAVLNAMNEIDCLRNYAVFKLETDEIIYKIQPLQFCEIIYDYKLKEIIYVNTDSITVNYQIKYPIDSLKMVLDNHLRNTSNDENYPSVDEKKLISINVDRAKSIVETKKLLIKIITDINDLNTKAIFAFIFEEEGIIESPIFEYDDSN